MRWISILASAIAAAGCAAPTPQDYAARMPRFDMRTYFDGRVEGWGMVQDRAGRVTKRMTVVIQGSWKGDVGKLDEQFVNDDGTKESRVWTVRKQGDRYVGTAGDVIGEAHGEAAGNALHWSYVLRAKRESGATIDLSMDDWMWLIDERTLANRTAFSKFGVQFGEVSFFFRKAN